MKLQNDLLEIDIHDDKPVIRSYLHKPSGQIIGADDNETPLSINGEEVAYADFAIDVSQNADSITHRLSTGGINFDYSVTLADCVCTLRINNIQGNLETLSFNQAPLLKITDGTYNFARITTSDPDLSGKLWHEDGKKWWREEFGTILTSEGKSLKRCMHGCLYQEQKVCAFLHSNFPLLPELHIRDASSYSVALADYRRKVRKVILPPLEVKIVFLSDYNGDGIIDWSDMAYWKNGQYDDADEFYKKCISYKIYLTHKSEDVLTTFEEATEIVRAISNLTGNMRQLVYLAGWQNQGNDDRRDQ